MKLLKVLFVFIIAIGSSIAFAHGEVKAGPHNGFIRMPGAFHTELVLVGKNKLKAECAVQRNYYLCSFPKSVDLTKTRQLKVLSFRKEQKGSEVTYPPPLKFEVIDDGHGGKC